MRNLFRSGTPVLLALVIACGLVGEVAAQADPASAEIWAKYYDRTAGRPPRPVLLEALSLFEREGRAVVRAVDAGCGSGIDTLYLLDQGITVHAFDSDAGGIDRLRARAGDVAGSRLRAEVATFHEVRLEAGADLVFAGYALPFARPEDFDEAWSRLTDALAVGGRFAGHLFGERDDWADLPDRTHHTREQVEALLAEGFEVEKLEELEKDRKMASGQVKHWHIFEIIARRVGE